MSENIYDTANQLERQIRNLPAYQAVLTAKKAIEADAETKTLFDEYRNLQGVLQTLLQRGEMPDATMQERLQSYQEKVTSNERLAAYFHHQEALSVYINDLEKLIFSPLSDLV